MRKHVVLYDKYRKTCKHQYISEVAQRGKEWEHKGRNNGKTIDEIENSYSTFTSKGLTEVPKRDG
jgi:hypothetical protein